MWSWCLCSLLSSLSLSLWSSVSLGIVSVRWQKPFPSDPSASSCLGFYLATENVFTVNSAHVGSTAYSRSHCFGLAPESPCPAVTPDLRWLAPALDGTFGRLGKVSWDWEDSGHVTVLRLGLLMAAVLTLPCLCCD